MELILGREDRMMFLRCCLGEDRSKSSQCREVPFSRKFFPPL